MTEQVKLEEYSIAQLNNICGNHDENFKMIEEGIDRYDVGMDVHKYRPVNFDEMSGFFICKFVFMNMKKISSNK